MKCVNCGKEFAEGERFCANCGSSVSQPSPPPPEPPVRETDDFSSVLNSFLPDMPATKVCSSCGSTMQEGEVYCRICGAKNTGAPTPASGVTFTDILKCPSCGNSYNQGEAFCRNCGIRLPAPAPQNVNIRKADNQKPVRMKNVKKPLPLKKLILAGAAFVAVALAVVLIVVLRGGSGGTGSAKFGTLGNNAMFPMASEESEKIYFMNGNGKIAAEASFEDFVGLQFSLDRSVAAMSDQEDSEGYYTVGTLTVITASGNKEVATRVAAYCVAGSGNSIAYVSNIDQDGIGRLYLYDVKSRTTVEIATKVHAPSGISLSPDGRSIAYVSDYKAYDNYKGYVSRNGAPGEELGKNYLPVALSNSAAIVYYIRDNSLYAYMNGDGEKLGSFSSSDYYSYNSILLNRDHTEIMFNDNDGRANIAVNGQSSRLSSSNLYQPIVPEGTASDSDWWGHANSRATTYDIKSFAETVWVLNSGIFFLDSRYELQKITSNYSGYVSDIRISADGLRLMYINDDALYYISDLRNPALYDSKTPYYDEEFVYNFYADINLGNIYIGNRRGELYYVGNGGKSVLIADGVDDALVSDNGVCYYISDYELYTSSRGAKGVKVSEIREDINSIFTFAGGVLLVTEADGYEYYYDIYYAPSGGVKPILVAEDITE